MGQHGHAPASHRLTLLLIAAAIGLIAAFGQQLAGPLPVRACSCAEPGPLAELIDDPRLVVFAATPGVQVVDRVPLSVSAWFHGEGAAPIVWVTPAAIPVGGGGTVLNTCGLGFTAGQAMFLVAYRNDPDPLSAGICSPHAPLNSPEGQALFSEALLVYGEPFTPTASDPPAATPDDAVPPTPTPTAPPEAPPPAPTTIDPGWTYVGAVVGGGALLLGLIALVALRRRPTA